MTKSPKQLDRDIAASLRDYDWDSFAEGAAFAFWASPYITDVEYLSENAREAKHAGDSKKAEKYEAAYKALSPGPGGAWESVLPEYRQKSACLSLRKGKLHERIIL